MTVREQLDRLARQFPLSKELAVSPEMYDEYAAGLTTILRYDSQAGPIGAFPPVEQFERIGAQRMPLMYRDRRLTCVVQKARETA